MPNWCFNEISIEYSEEEAMKIMEEIKGSKGFGEKMVKLS